MSVRQSRRAAALLSALALTVSAAFVTVTSTGSVTAGGCCRPWTVQV